MLPSQNRLKKKKDFQKVFKKGKGLRENLITLKWVNNNLETSRFGIVISKKISKKAVLRNKIRRRLREEIKKILPHFKKGIDIVIIANPGATKEKREKIAEDLKKIFYRARLISKE